MFEWLSKHWQAFWRSGPENLYTFIWWGILGTVVAAILAVASFILGLTSKWQDRFISAFLALLVAVLATIIQTLYRRNNNNSPLMISADEDVETMDQRLVFSAHVSISGEPKLVGTAPFIEFRQPVINASVLPIAFESVEGRIYIDGEEQKDQIEIRESQDLDVRRGTYREIILRQWLTSEVAKKMQNSLETIFDFGHAGMRFSFDHRGQKRTFQKALGNQVTWHNTERELSELL